MLRSWPSSGTRQSRWDFLEPAGSNLRAEPIRIREISVEIRRAATVSKVQMVAPTFSSRKKCNEVSILQFRIAIAFIYRPGRRVLSTIVTHEAPKCLQKGLHNADQPSPKSVESQEEGNALVSEPLWTPTSKNDRVPNEWTPRRR